MKAPFRPADRLKSEINRQLAQEKKATRERRTLLAQSAYLGTLGVMLALPIVVGAYLGSWLDSRLRGYSVSWTVTCILLGVFAGGFNVYWMIRENEG